MSVGAPKGEKQEFQKALKLGETLELTIVKH